MMNTMLKNFVSPAWAILEYGSYPLLLLISTPWFLHQLGTDQYGHWMLLVATISFGGVLNSGTGLATIKAVSAGIGGNVSGRSDLAVNASLAIAILGGGALALIVFCLFWFGAPVILSRMGEPEIVRATGTAAAILIWIEQLDNVFSSAIKGAEHFKDAARVEMASKATQIIAAAIVLFWFPTLEALYWTLLVVAVLRLSAKLIICKKLLSLIRVRPSFNGLSDVLHFAKWGWLQGVGGVMFGAADRLLIGSMLGASSLTYYAIASQLAMQTHAISAAGLSVIFPKVSRKLESGGAFSLSRFTRITTVGNLLLSTSLAMVLILIGPAFLRFWVGPESAEPATQLLPWLVAAYWILSLNSVSYYLLLGMGRIRFISLTVMAAGISAVIAAYFSIEQFGLIGSPAGRAAYAVLSLVLFIPVIQHLRNERDERPDIPTINSVPGGERLS
jgi:O-antigen/teichoic acid export membrane protein